MDQSQNAALYFVDRHMAEGRSAKTAFREVSGDRRSQTYGELAARSDQVAGAWSRIGIQREERVALLVLDQIEYPELFWGSLKAGVVPVPLNTLLSAPVYDTILRDSRAAVLVVSAELLDTVAPALNRNPFLRAVIVIGDAPEGTLSYADFMDGAIAQPAISTSADEVAFWLYTSGSTGKPKGARHVHGALQATSDSFGRQVLGITGDDLVFSAAKIFFAYGLGNAMTFPMAVGATTLLFNGRPTPDAVVDIIRDHRPTIFCGVPTLFAATLAALGGTAPDHRLRLCTSAGEALPSEIGNGWKTLWGCDILDGVGSTEMLHIFLANRPGDIVYGTSGVAVPGYELRCVTEDGREIAPGEVGELLVRGASAAEGYWNQRGKSRATFEGEWTRTGDKYEIREDGRYVYCGRTDDMFKVSGIWVSPFEVEQALVEHDAVLEAAVVAHDDETGLTKPRAFVVLKPGADAQAVKDGLAEFVKTRIGKWKYPRWVEVVEDLPKTATGKIQRFKLRETGG